MKMMVALLAVLAACFALLAAAPDEKTPKPQYDEKGQLVRPAG